MNNVNVELNWGDVQKISPSGSTPAEGWCFRSRGLFQERAEWEIRPFLTLVIGPLMRHL